MQALVLQYLGLVSGAFLLASEPRSNAGLSYRVEWKGIRQMSKHELCSISNLCHRSIKDITRHRRRNESEHLSALHEIWEALDDENSLPWGL